MLPPDTPNNQTPKPNQDFVKKTEGGGKDSSGATSQPTTSESVSAPETRTGLGRASLKKLAVHGAAWTVLGIGTAEGCRLAGNLVLTRLLAP